MNPKDYIKQTVKDIKVELTEQFDQNFQRKAFFNKKWPAEKYPNSKGSMMQRSGALRNGMRSEIQGDGIIFSNNMPYAQIQNEGGTIKVTAKMISFFWFMHYKSHNAQIYNVKKKAVAKTARNRKLQGEAAKWKAMALKFKVGDKIKIPQRQFIGFYPGTDKTVKRIVDYNFNRMAEDIGRDIHSKINRKARL